MAEFTDEFAENGGIAGLMEALAMHGTMQQRACVVVGVTGDGKSTTGNTLCGRDVFETSTGLCSATRNHEIGTYTAGGALNGTLWRIIDTIGFEDSCLPQDEV